MNKIINYKYFIKMNFTDNRSECKEVSFSNPVSKGDGIFIGDNSFLVIEVSHKDGGLSYLTCECLQSSK